MLVSFGKVRLDANRVGIESCWIYARKVTQYPMAPSDTSDWTKALDTKRQKERKALERRRFRHEKRVFEIIRKPYPRRIRDSLTTILKTSDSKAFSDYWFDCSTLFVTLSAYRGI